MSQAVNLRADGGNPPESAELLGTATLPGTPPFTLPQLLSIDGRLFRLVRDTFAFGAAVPAEYAEVTPVQATLDPTPKA